MNAVISAFTAPQSLNAYILVAVAFAIVIVGRMVVSR
jgi:hypothetical protein